MKKVLSIFVCLLAGLFVLVGCGGGDGKFVHDTKTYSKDGNELEFTIKQSEITTNTKHIMGSECLEFKIEVKAKATSEERGFEVYLANFNFYFTKPQSIFEMEMYATDDESASAVQRILVRKGSTQTIILRVYFNNLYNEEVKVEDDCFVLELCGVRI